MNKVVVLGVNSPIGLSLLRELGRAGFVTLGIGSADAIGHASRHCHYPVIRQSGEQALIRQLLPLGGEPGGHFLLAVSESDIDLINRHRGQLAQRFTLLVPKQRQMETVLNKSRTQQIAAGLGIESPRTLIIQRLDEVASGIKALSFPLVLKWANPIEIQPLLKQHGLGFHKLEYARDPQELMSRLAPYERLQRFPMIQEYCQGSGLGQFFLCKGGEAKITFQHQRLHEWPPEGGTSTYCRGVDLGQHKECLARSRALLKAINWDGVAMVEYRYCARRRRYVLMEINGRFWGSAPLAEHAGAGFAPALVRLLGLHQEVSQPRLKQRDCLYLIPEFKRLCRILFARNKIADPAGHFSRWNALITLAGTVFNHRCGYYVFCLDDPGPFFRDMLNATRKLLRS